MATKTMKTAKAKKRDRRTKLAGAAVAVPTDNFCQRVPEETGRELFQHLAAKHLHEAGRTDGARQMGVGLADGVEVVFYANYHGRHDLLTVSLFTVEELDGLIAGWRARRLAAEQN